MGFFKDAAKKGIGYVDRLSKADPQVISLVNERLSEQDKWNDVFSTKLIELLDNNDAIRSEIRRRLDQITAASRSQQDLIRAAEEHRALNVDYQKTSAMLSAAQEKFVRAETILLDAAELRERSAAYEGAERQLAEAREALQKFAPVLEEAKTKFQEAQQTASEVLRKAERFSDGAEAAGKEAETKFAFAIQKFDAANSALGVANTFAAEAGTAYEKASQLAQRASAAHAASVSTLAAAQTAIESATRHLAEAARSQEKSSENLEKAEALVGASEQRLSDATVEKQRTEATLAKAEKRAREAASYALVATVAALSICCWGALARGDAASQYGAILPVILSAVVVASGAYVWSKSR